MHKSITNLGIWNICNMV